MPHQPDNNFAGTQVVSLVEARGQTILLFILAAWSTGSPELQLAIKANFRSVSPVDSKRRPRVGSWMC
jgi:hypothetical protein